MKAEPNRANLRRGWTTGTMATAATKGALVALLENPDVTHGALIKAEVRLTKRGGVRFFGGKGVGKVTKRGLPLEVGEPAINPTPRWMMEQAVQKIAVRYGINPNVDITISVPEGERLAEKTWNPKLGIIGGVSILGTSGVVIPYSCGAWIASIRQGVDVALAQGASTLAATTGKTSAKGLQQACGINPEEIIEMGDFVGGLLKHIKTKTTHKKTSTKKTNPQTQKSIRLLLGGGFSKMAKLVQGHMDLHSKRSQFDPAFVASFITAPTKELTELKTGGELLELASKKARMEMAQGIANASATQVKNMLATNKTTKAEIGIEVGIFVFDKQANLLAKAF